MRRNSKAIILIGITLGVIVLAVIVLRPRQIPIQPIQAQNVPTQMPNQTTRAQNLPPQLPTIYRTPTPTRPAYCVPLPRAARPIGTPTPTPSRFTTAVPVSSAVPYLGQAVTHRVYDNVFDLSPEVPLRDKSEIIVFRCNGTFDQYWAGPEVDVDSFLNLEPGDVVYSSAAPASVMGHQPPTITPETLIQYPLSITPALLTQTRMAYPFPATPKP